MSIKFIQCFVFGHKYKIKRRITENIHELICVKCRKEFGINCKMKSVIPMDKDLKEAHEDLLKAVNILENYKK